MIYPGIPRWFTHDVGIPSNDLGISHIVFSSFTTQYGKWMERYAIHVVREICRLSFFGWKRPLNDEHVSLPCIEYVKYVNIYIYTDIYIYTVLLKCNEMAPYYQTCGILQDSSSPKSQPWPMDEGSSNVPRPNPTSWTSCGERRGSNDRNTVIGWIMLGFMLGLMDIYWT